MTLLAVLRCRGLVHQTTDDARLGAWLAERPHILATVRRRNPFVDVLNHTQIELRRRLWSATDEAERERIRGALFTTINGIAAGLQTAG